MGDEDTVKVPSAKELNNVEESVKHIRCGQIGVDGVVRGGLIAM